MTMKKRGLPWSRQHPQPEVHIGISEAEDPVFMAGFLSGVLFGRQPSLMDVEKEAILSGMRTDVLHALTDEKPAFVPDKWREFILKLLELREAG